MELLYQGFDGLDVSFQGRINHRFCAALEQVKLTAQKYHRDEFLEWCGIGMLVKESGARGGYSFTVRTETPHAVWFFKKPNPHDPWGVRVSCDSFQLAMHGLATTRTVLADALSKWGVQVPLGTESIGRVDYAMDFLAPDLVLEPNHFVMHSNCNRSDHHAPLSKNVRGKSGRVTSVTVGQMPGHQVIVYDKREEVIAKRKFGWHTIWDASRVRQNKPRLDYTDPSSSRVWRIEVRSGKRHLKNAWSLRTWEDLDRIIGDLFSNALRAVRYTIPSHDTNRARWCTHPIWEKAQKAIADDLFDLRNFAEPSTVKQVQFQAYDKLLASQIVGLYIARAGLHRIKSTELISFVVAQTQDIIDDLNGRSKELEPRLARATDRLRILVPYDSPSSDEVT